MPTIRRPFENQNVDQQVINDMFGLTTQAEPQQQESEQTEAYAQETTSDANAAPEQTAVTETTEQPAAEPAPEPMPEPAPEPATTNATPSPGEPPFTPQGLLKVMKAFDDNELPDDATFTRNLQTNDQYAANVWLYLQQKVADGELDEVPGCKSFDDFKAVVMKRPMFGNGEFKTEGQAQTPATPATPTPAATQPQAEVINGAALTDGGQTIQPTAIEPGTPMSDRAKALGQRQDEALKNAKSQAARPAPKTAVEAMQATPKNKTAGLYQYMSGKFDMKGTNANQFASIMSLQDGRKAVYDTLVKSGEQLPPFQQWNQQMVMLNPEDDTLTPEMRLINSPMYNILYRRDDDLYGMQDGQIVSHHSTFANTAAGKWAANHSLAEQQEVANIFNAFAKQISLATGAQSAGHGSGTMGGNAASASVKKLTEFMRDQFAKNGADMPLNQLYDSTKAFMSTLNLRTDENLTRSLEQYNFENFFQGKGSYFVDQSAAQARQAQREQGNRYFSSDASRGKAVAAGMGGAMSSMVAGANEAAQFNDVERTVNYVLTQCGLAKNPTPGVQVNPEFRDEVINTANQAVAAMQLSGESVMAREGYADITTGMSSEDIKQLASKLASKPYQTIAQGIAEQIISNLSKEEQEKVRNSGWLSKWAYQVGAGSILGKGIMAGVSFGLSDSQKQLNGEISQITADELGEFGTTTASIASFFLDDMFLQAGGAVGSLASKALRESTINRITARILRAAPGASPVAVRRMAERSLANHLGMRMSQSILGSTQSLGFFDAAGGVADNILRGGVVYGEDGQPLTDEKGKKVTESAWNALWNGYAHGLTGGLMIGAANPLYAKYVGTRLAYKPTNGFLKKVGKFTLDFAGKVASEGTAFALPDLVAMAAKGGHDTSDYLNTIWGSWKFMIAMKGSHLLFSPLKRKKGQPSEFRMGPQGLVTNGITHPLSKDAMAELAENGYGKDIYEIAEKVLGGKDIVFKGEDLIQYDAENKVYLRGDATEGLTVPEELESFMNDKNISASTKNELMALITNTNGVSFAIPYATRAEMRTLEDGSVAIETYDDSGTLIKRGYFANDSKAQKAFADLNAVASANRLRFNADKHEREVSRQFGNQALREVAEEMNFSSEEFNEVVSILNGETEAQTENGRRLVNEVRKRFNQLRSQSGQTSADIFRQVEEQTGIDIQKALKKKPGKLTENEVDAISQAAEMFNELPQRMEARRKRFQDIQSAGEQAKTLSQSTLENSIRLQQAEQELQEVLPEGVTIPESIMDIPALIEQHPEIEAELMEYAKASNALNGAREAMQEKFVSAYNTAVEQGKTEVDTSQKLLELDKQWNQLRQQVDDALGRGFADRFAYASSDEVMDTIAQQTPENQQLLTDFYAAQAKYYNALYHEANEAADKAISDWNNANSGMESPFVTETETVSEGGETTTTRTVQVGTYQGHQVVVSQPKENSDLVNIYDIQTGQVMPVSGSQVTDITPADAGEVENQIRDNAKAPALAKTQQMQAEVNAAKLADSNYKYKFGERFYIYNPDGTRSIARFEGFNTDGTANVVRIDRDETSGPVRETDVENMRLTPEEIDQLDGTAARAGYQQQREQYEQQQKASGQSAEQTPAGQTAESQTQQTAAGNVQSTAENVQQTAEPQAPASPVSVGQPMPMTDKGEPDYLKATPAKTAEYILKDAVEGLDITPEEARQNASEWAHEQVGKTQKELDKLQARKPKMTNPAKYRDEFQKWKDNIARLNDQLAHFQEVERIINEQPSEQAQEQPAADTTQPSAEPTMPENIPLKPESPDQTAPQQKPSLDSPELAQAQQFAENLGLPFIFTSSDSDIHKGNEESKKRSAEAYFTADGRLVLNVDNNASWDMINQKILHEGVGHYGLQRLFGDDFDTFLDNVWEAAAPELRRGISQWLNYNPQYTTDPQTGERILNQQATRREAVNEYMSRLAEKTDFTPQERTLWNRIKDFFMRMLRRKGFNIKQLTDDDLRNILRESHQNLIREEQNRRDITGQATQSEVLRPQERIETPAEPAKAETPTTEKATEPAQAETAKAETPSAEIPTPENIAAEQAKPLSEKQKQPGVDHSQLFTPEDFNVTDTENTTQDADDSTKFSLTKRTRATIEGWLKKRQDISEEQRNEVLDYLDQFNDSALQLAAGKWTATGKVRLPEDMEKIQQAVEVAKKAKVDPLSYESPMQLIEAHADIQIKEKPIDPATVHTLSNPKDIGNGVVIYDVADTEESRQNMRRIINTHFGKETSPWCLLQGDKEGNLTPDSEGFWYDVYNRYPKQVAFQDGRLIAFSANDTRERVWWDRQDNPTSGVPIAVKRNDIAKGARQIAQMDPKTGEISGEGGKIFKGEQFRPNERYEEWYPNGQHKYIKLFDNTGKKITELHAWIENGTKVHEYYEGVHRKEWYNDGTPRSFAEFDEEGNKTIRRWDTNGQLDSESKFDTHDNGILKTYREGRLLVEVIRSDDGHSEERRSYDYDENLFNIARLKDGKKDGVQESFFSHNRSQKEIYKEGELLRKEEYKDGTLLRLYTNKEGLLIDEYYNDKGIIELRETRNVDLGGRKEEFFDDEGNLKTANYIKDGTIYRQETYNPDGTLKETLVSRNGKLVPETPQETDTTRYSRNVGGNKGYVGYSMSKRAQRARGEGKYPKTDFKREYNIGEKPFSVLLETGFISDSEWHHTSSHGNRTKFCAWIEPWMADAYTENKAEIDRLCRDYLAKNTERANLRGDWQEIAPEMERIDKEKDSIISQIENLMEGNGNSNTRYSADPFYSNAEHAVQDIRQDKATADQWLAMLRKNGGLKAGEDKWLGLSDWLNEQKGKSVTKQDILNYISQNKIKVEEVKYGDNPYLETYPYDDGVYLTTAALNMISKRYGLEDGEYSYVPKEGFEFWGDGRLESARKVNDKKKFVNEEDYDLTDEYKSEEFISDVQEYMTDDLDGWIISSDLDKERFINPTRLQYTTDGLTNKREIALTVPGIEPYNASDTIHFGDAGKGRAVAWIRFGDTTDSEGNRVLVIDEIQSKRHQDGRKLGYGENAVPDAPFDKNWQELAMKRMLRYAAENGYDKVAWTTGQQQSKRYGIGDVIDSIRTSDWSLDEGYEWDLDEPVKTVFVNGTSLADERMELVVKKDGVIVSDINGTYNGHNITELFGRDVAKKILQDGEQDINTEGLVTGDKGMKTFYDQIIPSFMDKYTKKWGTRTHDIKLPEVEAAGQTMHAVDVTPEMKESVMQGQTLFSRQYTPETEEQPLSSFNPLAHVTDNLQRIAEREEGRKPIDWSDPYEAFRRPRTAAIELSRMTDRELLQHSRTAEGYTDDWNFFNDEYDRRHRSEYAQLTEHYTNLLERAGTSLEDAYSMLNAANQRWNYGAYATDERTELRAQRDTLDAYIADKEQQQAEAEDSSTRYSRITDQATIDRLEAEKLVPVYRSMLQIDGRLYPPMASLQEGTKQLKDYALEGWWIQADEHPENAYQRNGKWYVNITKDNGDSLPVAYNPYLHTSDMMMNDQFASAQDRPNLVVVRMLVPQSEIQNPYQADRAHKPTGWTKWNAGVIEKKIGGQRNVLLTRYGKIDKVLSPEEVARNIYDNQLRDLSSRTELPTNVFDPATRAELEKLGVRFIITDNRGRILSGPDQGKTWTQAYYDHQSRLNAERKASEKAHYDRKAEERLAQGKVAVPDISETNTPVSSFTDVAAKEIDPKDNGTRFSYNTEQTVQEKLRNYALTKEAKKAGWTPEKVEDIIKESTEFIEAVHLALTGDHNYDDWSKKNPTVLLDWRDGKSHPVVTWSRGNIEYKYDVSAGLLCLNNEAMEDVMRHPAMFEALQAIDNHNKDGFTSNDYGTLYQVMRDGAFVVPCKGCFDFAGRLKMLAKVSHTFADEVNQAVDERNKNHEAYDRKLRADARKAQNKENQKAEAKGSTPDQKMSTIGELPLTAATRKRAIRIAVAGDNITQHIDWRDLMTADGQTGLLAQYGGLFRAWQRMGAGRPKDKLNPEPYTGDISATEVDEDGVPRVRGALTIIAPFGKRTPSFRAAEVNQGTSLRGNSHDEYRPVNIIDEFQMIRDCFVKDLMYFKYSKELDDPRLFGHLGVKFNLSFFPDFKPDGVAAGLDKNGNFTASEESVGAREFPYTGEDGKQHYDGLAGLEEAKKLQNRDTSISAVAMSVPHLIKLLCYVPTPEDPSGWVGSIIPFHATGASKTALKQQGLGEARAISPDPEKGRFEDEAFVDYNKGVTNFEQVQNDRFADGWVILEGKKKGTKVNPGHKLEFANGTHYYNQQLGIHLFKNGYAYDSELPGGKVTDAVKRNPPHQLVIDYNDKVREIGTKHAYKDAADFYLNLLPSIGMMPRFEFRLPEDIFLKMCKDADEEPTNPKLGWQGPGHDWIPTDSPAYYALWGDFGMTDGKSSEWAQQRAVGVYDENGNRTFSMPDNAIDIAKKGLELYTERRDSEKERVDGAVADFIETSVRDGRMSQKDADAILGKYNIQPSTRYSLPESGDREERTLMGVHNISERKLADAIRLGGLANPSLAVIDTKNGMHTDYGEISLIPRSDLIDSRSGRNAGTWAGDAWTPTYPQVEKIMSDKGRDAYYEDVRGVSDNRELTGRLKMVWDNYLEGRDPDDLAYWFFKDQGVEPEKVFFDSGFSEEQRKRYAELTDNGRKGFGEMSDDERSGIISMMAEQEGITAEEKLAKYRNLRERNAELLAKDDLRPFKKVMLQRTIDEIDKYGLTLSPVNNFLYGMKQALKNDGKLDVDGTLKKSRDKIQTDGKEEDFRHWLEEKERRYGVKEMLFDGYTRDGDRKYVPNTVENASRMMNREPEANSGGQTGFGASRAMLLEKMHTLAEIRKQKGKLKGVDEDSEQLYKAASDEMFEVVNALSDMQKISDNPFSNVEYANARLNEALGKKDPIGYLNKEFGYKISKGGEFSKKLKSMVETLENLPVKYFETKFRRPVQLNEFAVAVVPEKTSAEVVKALKDAGLDVRTYDGTEEGRQKVTMDAVRDRDDVRFSLPDQTPADTPADTPSLADWNPLTDIRRNIDTSRNARQQADQAWGDHRARREQAIRDAKAINNDAGIPQAAKERLKVDLLRKVADVRSLVSKVREGDRQSVQAVTKTVLDMADAVGDGLTRGAVKRIMHAIDNATTRRDVKSEVDKAVDVILTQVNREVKREKERLLKTKATKLDPNNVRVAGQLDERGQRTLKQLNELLTPDGQASDIDSLEVKLADEAQSDRQVTAGNAADKLIGVKLAKVHRDTIGETQKGIDTLKQQRRELEDELYETITDDEGNIVSRRIRPQFLGSDAKPEDKARRESINQQIDAINDAIQESRVQLIRDTAAFNDQLSEVIERGKAARRTWAEEQKMREDDILHDAFTDLQDSSSNPYETISRRRERIAEGKRPTTAKERVGHWFAKSLGLPFHTFDTYLRKFGQKAPQGEGYLWQRFSKQWEDSATRLWLESKQDNITMDEKVKELFGEEYGAEHYKDIYKVCEKMDAQRRKEGREIVIDYTGPDGTHQAKMEVGTGQALYILLADQQPDGRMKLRAQGITEAAVEQIRAELDPRIIQMGDWIVNDFLPKKREWYNQTYKRVFGADMKETANYFPIKIFSNARHQAVDVGAKEGADAKPSTTTGSIIERTRNTLPLDPTADAFDVLSDHIKQMNDWAAWAEMRRDLNMLNSSTAFRNKVENLPASLSLGTGKDMFEQFKTACALATGAYDPKSDAGSKFIVGMAKNITAAKIAFRVHTALKQLLSHPAFWSDARPDDLIKAFANFKGTWDWAMQTLPILESRWKSRTMGDTRLADTGFAFSGLLKNVTDAMAKGGMLSNAFIDAYTCASGARAVYNTKMRYYENQLGLSHEDAHERAVRDATFCFNQSQQSSEGMFVSQVQRDRGFGSVMFTTFRNGPMGYERQLRNTLSDLHALASNSKADIIAYRKGQLINEFGLSEDAAQSQAEKDYGRRIRKDLARLAVFGYVVGAAWNMGGNLWYYLFGDDDEQKANSLAEDMLHGIATPIEGLAGGNWLSDLYNNTLVKKMTGGEPNISFTSFFSVPMQDDIDRVLEGLGKKDPIPAYANVLNLLAQGVFGTNLATLTDAYAAVVDAAEGYGNAESAEDIAEETLLAFTRVIQAPTGSTEGLYLDRMRDKIINPDGTVNIDQFEKWCRRYVEFKKMKDGDGFLYQIFDDAQADERYHKRIQSKIEERGNYFKTFLEEQQLRKSITQKTKKEKDEEDKETKGKKLYQEKAPKPLIEAYLKLRESKEQAELLLADRPKNLSGPEYMEQRAAYRRWNQQNRHIVEQVKAIKEVYSRVNQIVNNTTEATFADDIRSVADILNVDIR